MSLIDTRRKNYFVNRRFQLEYTLSIVLTLLIVMFVSGAGLYLGVRAAIIENFEKFKVSQDLENVKRIAEYEQVRYRKGDYRLDRTFREAELLSEKERASLQGALRSVNHSLVPKVIALAVVIFIGGIFASHKIAGPMYRFERSALAVRDGDLTVNFRIRKSDKVRGVALVLEEMIDALRADISTVKHAAYELEEAAKAVATEITTEQLSRLSAIIKELNAVSSRYKT